MESQQLEATGGAPEGVEPMPAEATEPVAVEQPEAEAEVAAEAEAETGAEAQPEPAEAASEAAEADAEAVAETQPEAEAEVAAEAEAETGAEAQPEPAEAASEAAEADAEAVAETQPEAEAEVAAEAEAAQPEAEAETEPEAEAKPLSFACDRGSIVAEITRAGAVAHRSMKDHLSIISCVLLRLNGNDLTIRSTDLHVSYEAVVQVDGKADGVIAVPAEKLSGIVKSLPAGEVRFQEGAKGVLRIVHKESCRRASLRSMSSQHFPPVVEMADCEEVTIPGKDLEYMLRMSHFATGDDETRVFMSGVYFSREGEVLAMTSTNGARLAHATRGTDAGNDFGVILPTRVLHEIRKAGFGDDYTVLVNEREVRFATGKERWETQVLDAQFPNYKRVIPDDESLPHRLVIDRKVLIAGVGFVAGAVKTQSRRVCLDFSSNSMAVRSDKDAEDEARQEVACEYDGPDITFGLNYEYLLDPLRAFDTDYVAFRFCEPGKAIVLDADPEQSTAQLLMPMEAS